MISILSLTNVLEDGKFLGDVARAFNWRPESADELQALLVAREAGLYPELLAKIGDLEAKVTELNALLNPPPEPKYYQVVALDKPEGDATHVGVLRPPAIDGAWEVNLLRLREGSEGRYIIVKAGVQIPAGEELTSLAKLTAGPAISDISAVIEADRLAQSQVASRKS